jgi:acyl-CoA synthetase (NDP forming)
MMVTEIKGYKILQGFRDKSESDLEAVISALLKLSRLAQDLEDRIAEIDINPLIVFRKGCGLKVVDALVVLR